MSTNEDERSPSDPFREYDGDTYGSAHGFDEDNGDFKRGNSAQITMIKGPTMVANQLVRTLKTPKGDDPFRPEFGLDKQELLGNSQARTKQAIIDAIGPDADPRVSQLGFGDIEITFPEGNRDADIMVTATLADGTPLQFAARFRDLLGVDGSGGSP